MCELFIRYNLYRKKTPFRFFVFLLLFLSSLNLTDQNTRFSGCFIDMYFGSGGFDCYMTSQIEKRGDSVTSYVLSPGYSHLSSARRCVLPSIESLKAYKQLFCLNSLN